MQQAKISVIIPMKNESLGIPFLFEGLKKFIAQLPLAYELILINDGSTDDTLEQLLNQKKHFNLKIIDFSRNFGKENAMHAGFSLASGDCAVVMDADLQDPPELILEMISHWQAGFEIVTAVREDRGEDSFVKKNTAHFFYQIINFFATESPITPNAGDFRLLDRAAITAFLSLDERIRFTKGLFSWIGFKEKKIYHKREKRATGKTNWNYWKLLKFSLDGITSFSKTPLDLFLYAGFFVLGSSFLYGLYYLIKTLVFGIDLPGYPSLLILILFFGGLQMIGLGIMGQYIGRIFIETKRRPLYLIRKIYE